MGGFHASRSRAVIRAVPIIALAILLIASSPPAIGPPAGWRDRALSYADTEHMFGPLHATASGYAGSFVSFQFDEATLVISDFIVSTPSRTTSVFQTIIPQVAANGISILNGSVFAFVSIPLNILVNNNPASALIITSSDESFNVTFTLSPGIDADRNGQSLNISSPDITARLYVTEDATVSLAGAVATVHLPVGTKVIFRADATAGEDVAGASGQQQLGDACVRNLVALEGYAVALEGFVEMSDTVYGRYYYRGANLTASGIEIGLEGTSAPLSIIALHLHESIIPVDGGTRISVTLDGQPVSELSSFDDILNHSGGESTYSFITGSKGLLLLVEIPQGGDYILKVEKIIITDSQGLNIIQLAAIVAVVLALLGVAAAVMLRRRPPQ